MRKVVSVAFAVVAAAALWVTPAPADGPGVGTPWVVSVGDSAISGEAGRWAGNTNNCSATSTRSARPPTTTTPATPPSRSRAATARRRPQIHIGGGVNSAEPRLLRRAHLHAACGSGSDFKPGLDFYNDGAGHKGQALALQQFAATHNVKMVVGADRRQQLRLRRHRADVRHRLAHVAVVVEELLLRRLERDVALHRRERRAPTRPRIKDALLNVRQAMATPATPTRVHDHRADLLVAAPARRPASATRSPAARRQTRRRLRLLEPRRRLGQRHRRRRRSTTRCATPRRQTGLTQHEVLDAQNALVGRRLCENTVGLLEEKGVASWTTAGAADKTEWVSQIRTTTTIFGPYQLQEGVHPNYWGQLALRNCLRQAYNGGAPRAGTCTARRPASTPRASRT